MKKVAFTVCAKNYLAQAITLKESFIKNNPDVDFSIFLSDKLTDEIKTEVIGLDNAWIPDWEDMAFKYGVVEFSTAIKPFCYKLLFAKGYDKVMYLDPDIYVVSNLKYIWNILDSKSGVLSPHYCKIIPSNYNGTTTEEELLFVGVFNLGFCSFKNDKIGNKIIDWWCDRLRTSCYYDKDDALHVDQKWMDFIPAFYPDSVEICRHPGVNAAVWNLHERELMIDNDKYYIKYKDEDTAYELLFYHFSGFDPFKKHVFNRRLPQYNITDYPSFKPIIDEYVEREYANGYDYYSKLKYSFNEYSNGELITQLQRRIYRVQTKAGKTYISPFLVNGAFYKLLEINSLLSKVAYDGNVGPSTSDKKSQGRFVNLMQKLLSVMLKCFGIRKYTALLVTVRSLTRLENQQFLIKKTN